MNILSVFGTRPEAIKMAPVVRALNSTPGVVSQVCVTGQHSEMLRQVTDLFEITPDIDLQIMKSGQGLTHITTAVLTGMQSVFETFKPDYVLVHGDTTTSMASAMAAFYAGIPIGHVEAGLRTRNLLSPWPEEANRQITGRLASLHFAPTNLSKENLLAEAVSEDSIHVTGNTVIDALNIVRERIENDHELSSAIAAEFPFIDTQKRLILVTGHRRENHDGGIANVCRALARLSERGDVQIVFPVHLNPIVKTVVHDLLDGHDDIHLLEPVSYLPFVWLLANSTLVITDSGGIQEEAPSFGKPVLVTRNTTERPEAVEAGTVKLTGTDFDLMVTEANLLLDDSDAFAAMARAHNPYGDGRAAGRIAEILSNLNEFTRVTL